MKKFLVGIISLLVLTLSLGLAACDKGEYFILTFEEKDGVTYESEIMSGAQVLNGYDVTFKLKLEDGVEGTPVVNANESVLTASEDGVYTFTMKEDTTVSVSGVNKIRKCNVAFDKGDYRISYECEQGDAEEGFIVDAGDKIRFKVNVSSYYVDKYEVAVNTEIVTADSDGWYSAFVTDDTTVRLYGLEQELGFTDREDGGRGTAQNPYKISRPIDLFYMAELVNNPFWVGTGYYEAHYKLMNDIDMEGEQMFIIGDMTSNSAFFGGQFDGNGHTIKNFYISDVKIEQENFTEVFMPYVGMFGYAAATTTTAPQIYNLTLSDFTIDVNAQKHGEMFAAGGIVGVGIGANVIGCRVENATITADADLGYFGYMGGIIGVHQSAYETDQMRFYACINSCSADVDIAVDSGYVYAAGGIAGYQMSYEEKTTAFILNSYSTGSVTGAIHAGGIVGRMDSNTSVQACYSDGVVEAQTSIGVTGDDAADAYAHAYAGGITGFADNEAIIADSFSKAKVYAYAEINDKAYEHAGSVVGYVNKAGSIAINTQAALIVNSYGADAKVEFNNDFFKNTLKWSEADWSFGEGYPTTNKAETSKTFTVTARFGNETVDSENLAALSVTNTYIPMSYWYLRADTLGQTGLSQYVNADGGKRSHGYYFDEQKTLRVPYGYVPTRDVTLYAGFADYSEVAGVYQVIPAATLSISPSDNVTVTLKDDGTALLADGARITSSSYYYLGDSKKTVYIEWTALARLGVYADEETAVNAENYYYTFKASVSGGVLTAYDGAFITEQNAVKAVKPSAFITGGYYCGEKEISFYKNGYGSVEGGDGFTYTVDGNSLSISYLTTGAVVTGSVDFANGTVTILSDTYAKYDDFKGVWESVSTYRYAIKSDGKGKAALLGYKIEDGKFEPYTIKEGSYTATANGYSIAFVGDLEPTVVTENADGSLNVDGENYYRENSLVGRWTYRNVVEPVFIDFAGIGADGVGKATITYGTDNAYELTYECVASGWGKSIVLYEGDFAFAQLAYDENKRMLTGDVYDALTGYIFDNVTFVTYDVFAGNWTSTITGLEEVTFNGLGFYSVTGNLETLSINGKVSVNGRTSGKYEIIGDMLSAKMINGGVEYKLTYENGRIAVADSEGNALGYLDKNNA